LSGYPTNQDLVARFRRSLRAAARTCLVRFKAEAAKRGSASRFFTSASVATLTCARVMLRDRFAFGMVHVATNDLIQRIPFGTSVPSLTRYQILQTGISLINPLRTSAFLPNDCQERASTTKLRHAQRMRHECAPPRPVI
jgi:hypothetical protein